jgi:hypothetical protein
MRVCAMTVNEKKQAENKMAAGKIFRKLIVNHLSESSARSLHSHPG